MELSSFIAEKVFTSENNEYVIHSFLNIVLIK